MPILYAYCFLNRVCPIVKMLLVVIVTSEMQIMSQICPSYFKCPSHLKPLINITGLYILIRTFILIFVLTFTCTY